jgi:nucleoside-diphosphate-sugar epimerase
MRALVTGAAGFIGLALSRSLLDEGWEVDLADDFSRGKQDRELAALSQRQGVELFPINLTNAGATDQLAHDYDRIFHFAAIIGVARVIAHPYETLSRNVEMTIEMLRLARRQRDLSVFVFASTSEVYAGSLLTGDLQFPTPESSPLVLPPLAAPRTSYMLSKLYGEALLLQSGVPGVIVRPHNIYGPRMGTEHVIPELMKRMQGLSAGDDLSIASPTHIRTFCYIDDAIGMISRLAGNPDAVGQPWNIGTESPEVTIFELAEIIRQVLGSPVRLVPGEETQGSPTRRCPAMQRTDSATGWHQRVPLTEGIARTYEWYSRNLFAPASSIQAPLA